MKKKNIRIRHSRFRFHWILTGILISTIACEKMDPVTPYDPGTPPLRIGSYEIMEKNASGHQMIYEMGVRWIKNNNTNYHQIEFCNFGDLKINIIAYLDEDLHISIPTQQFSTDLGNLEIFQGKGRITEDGLELTYWAGNQEQNYKSEIQALKN